MEAQTFTFVVEHAGCPSCAARVRDALAPLAAVEDVEIDEPNDAARVRLGAADGVTEDDVNALLAAASAEDHEYRVEPRSWRPAAAPART